MRLPRQIRLFRALPLLLMLAGAVSAQDAKDPAALRFDFAYHILRSADDARSAGDPEGAMILYEEAAKTYRALMREYPSWEPSIARFRAEYCEHEFATLKRLHPQPTVPPPAEDAPPGEVPQAPPIAPLPPVVPAPPVAVAAPPPPPVADQALTNLLAKARGHLQAGQAEEARTALLEAMRLAPDDVTVRLMIATAQCMLGEYADARFVLETLAVEQPGNMMVPLALSSAYLGLGAPSRARDHLLRVLELAPESPQGHANLARVLMLLDPTNRVEARVHYDQAVTLGASADPTFEAQLASPEEPPAAQ